MHTPPLFRDRSRPVQVLLGGVIPALVGAVAGILLGVSAAGTGRSASSLGSAAFSPDSNIVTGGAAPTAAWSAERSTAPRS